MGFWIWFSTEIITDSCIVILLVCKDKIDFLLSLLFISLLHYSDATWACHKCGFWQESFLCEIDIKMKEKMLCFNSNFCFVYWLYGKIKHLFLFIVMLLWSSLYFLSLFLICNIKNMVSLSKLSFCIQNCMYKHSLGLKAYLSRHRVCLGVCLPELRRMFFFLKHEYGADLLEFKIWSLFSFAVARSALVKKLCHCTFFFFWDDRSLVVRSHLFSFKYNFRVESFRHYL